MSIADSEALLAEASVRARDASNILSLFKDEPEDVYINTGSGQIPSLREWLRLRRSETDQVIADIQEEVVEFDERLRAIIKTDGTLNDKIVSEETLVDELKAKIDQLTKLIASSSADEGAGSIGYDGSLDYVPGTVGKNIKEQLALIQDIKQSIDILNDNISSIDEQLTGIDQAIDDIEESLATTKDDVTSLGNDYTALFNAFNNSIANRTLQAVYSFVPGDTYLVPANQEHVDTVACPGISVSKKYSIALSVYSPTLPIDTRVVYEALVTQNNAITVRIRNLTNTQITLNNDRKIYLTAIEVIVP